MNFWQRHIYIYIYTYIYIYISISPTHGNSHKLKLSAPTVGSQRLIISWDGLMAVIAFSADGLSYTIGIIHVVDQVYLMWRLPIDRVFDDRTFLISHIQTHVKFRLFGTMRLIGTGVSLVQVYKLIAFYASDWQWGILDSGLQRFSMLQIYA